MNEYMSTVCVDAWQVTAQHFFPPASDGMGMDTPAESAFTH